MIPGPVLFARFAYPPNSLGYCGPDDSAAVRDYAVTGTADRGLAELAGMFSGALPYLQLIAAASHIADPLDERVVHAYWLGGPQLERVGPSVLAAPWPSGSSAGSEATGPTWRPSPWPVPVRTTTFMYSASTRGWVCSGQGSRRSRCECWTAAASDGGVSCRSRATP